MNMIICSYIEMIERYIRYCGLAPTLGKPVTGSELMLGYSQGVPPNHSFLNDFPIKTIHFGDSSMG